MPNADDHRIAALARDYLTACYRCEGDGHWRDIVVGAATPDVERWFPAAVRFGLLSAWNPLSVPRARAANEDADEVLRAALAEAGFAVRRSLASAPDGTWPEPGWLAADLALPDLDALARRFRQLGALHWDRGEPVRLRIYRPRPARWSGPAVIDWVE